VIVAMSAVPLEADQPMHSDIEEAHINSLFEDRPAPLRAAARRREQPVQMSRWSRFHPRHLALPQAWQQHDACQARVSATLCLHFLPRRTSLQGVVCLSGALPYPPSPGCAFLADSHFIRWPPDRCSYHTRQTGPIWFRQHSIEWCTG
jgi:hypothetical protein